jgi:predicted esterase
LTGVFGKSFSTMASRNPIEVAALGKHTATVIVAHGLGDTGAGWVFLAEQWLMQKKFEHVKFIFPTGPTRKITIVSAFTLLLAETDLVRTWECQCPAGTILYDEISHSFAL